MKTTAHPARALSSSRVGLGAWLVPPTGPGRSACQENDPPSITAWPPPSERALTVGLLLALSGCSSHRWVVSLMVSGFISGTSLFSRFPRRVSKLLRGCPQITNQSRVRRRATATECRALDGLDFPLPLFTGLPRRCFLGNPYAAGRIVM